jgi:membrane protease YdiL (CAAX protease family)
LIAFSGYMATLEPLFNSDYKAEPDITSDNGLLVLFYLVVCVSILPAITEELLFRGVIMRGLGQYGRTFAIVVSALLFCMAHGSMDQFVLQFLAGILLGFIVYETKSMLAGMIVHFTNNFMSVVYAFLCSYIYAFKGESVYVYYEAAITAFSTIIGVVCLVVGLIYFKKYIINNYKLKETGRSFGNDEIKYVYNENGVEKTAVWHEELELRNNGEDKKFLNGNGEYVSVRKKANKTAVIILLCVCIIAALTFIVLTFTGKY